jgi:hypothetical protein
MVGGWWEECGSDDRSDHRSGAVGRVRGMEREAARESAREKSGMDGWDGWEVGWKWMDEVDMDTAGR